MTVQRVAADMVGMRQQHDDAEEIAAAIVAAVTEYRDEYDAIGIARQIAKLNALLRVHFAYEDWVLYPAMIAGADRQAAEMAYEFHQEMAGLAQQFEDFTRRWSGPTVIGAAFEDFREDATALFAALGARIERENDLLYPLAERSLTKAAA